VLNGNFQMNIKEKDNYIMIKQYNKDLWLLIEYMLMNNTKLYSQIEKNMIGIKPTDVFDIIKNINTDTYKQITDYMYDHMKMNYVKDFNVLVHEKDTYDECKKIIECKQIMYEIFQMYQILYPGQYYESLNKYFNINIQVNDLLFSRDEIIFVKINHNNLHKIIISFIKYIK
jgi:hypothetical protein